MASSNNQYYKDQYAKYQAASDEYNRIAKENSGEEGYRKSYQTGKRDAAELTDAQAGRAANQAETAYRRAGLSRAESAALAGGQNAQAYQNNYNQNFQNQQNQMNAQQANRVNAASNYANQQGQMTQMQQQEGQNEYERKWGNIANTTGTVSNLLGMFVSSDSRLKMDVQNVSAQESSDRIGAILDRHKKRDYHELCVGCKR